MQIFETDRIEIRAKYDIVKHKTIGSVHLRQEDNQKVGFVSEDERGTIQLYIKSDFIDRDCIAKDYNQLKNQLVDYANFWHAREERTV